MELHNTFTVPVPVDEAWRVMLDVNQLAPCMPGATVDQVEGDDVFGRVKVKLGPIAITYKGKLTFVERDELNHHVVLNAAAQEMRGSGTAAARITAGLHEKDGITEVAVTTDLNITGKPAQFGRGVMADVSERIIDQFAGNLAREIQGGTLQSAPPSEGTSEPAPRGFPTAEGLQAKAAPVAELRRSSTDALDLVGAAGAPMLRRLVPALAGLALLALIVGRKLRDRQS